MYKTNDIIEKSIEVIKEQNLIFIGDIFAYTIFSKDAFYDHKCHENEEIKKELQNNRVLMKQNMRKKWYKSDNAALQISLMKLIGDESEVQRLNNSKHEIKHDNKDNNINVKIIK
jgi:hypothetical protein